MWDVTDDDNPCWTFCIQVQFWDPPNGGPRKPQLFAKMNKPHEFGFLLYPASPPAAQYPVAASEAPYQRFNAPTYGGEQASQKLAELRAFAVQLCSAGNPGAGEQHVMIYFASNW